MPVGAMPRLPASAAARSLRMSACRLVATTVSMLAGRLTMRAVIASTLNDDRFAKLADPAGFLRKLVIRLEILRVDAEIAMNTRLQKEAQARGDEDASNSHSRRGVELRQTKEGLKTALQRP